MTRYEQVQKCADKLNKELRERGSNNFRYVVGIRYKLLRIPIKLVFHNEQEEMNWE